MGDQQSNGYDGVGEISNSGTAKEIVLVVPKQPTEGSVLPENRPCFAQRRRGHGCDFWDVNVSFNLQADGPAGQLVIALTYCFCLVLKLRQSPYAYATGGGGDGCGGRFGPG